VTEPGRRHSDGLSELGLVRGCVEHPGWVVVPVAWAAGGGAVRLETFAAQPVLDYSGGRVRPAGRRVRHR